MGHDVANESLANVLTLGATEAVRDVSDDFKNGWRLVGGAATRYWVGSGVASELDVATGSLGDLPPTVGVSKFETWHWHPPNATGEHYAMLGHTATGAKIDIYTSQPGEPEPIMVPLGMDDITVPVRDPNSQLVMSTLWLLRRVTTDFGFGPHDKAISRVQVLRPMADWPTVDSLWQKWASRYADLGFDAKAAMTWAIDQARVQKVARVSMARHYAKLAVGDCGGCYRRDPEHPVVPFWKIAAGKLSRKLLPG